MGAYYYARAGAVGFSHHVLNLIPRRHTNVVRDLSGGGALPRDPRHKRDHLLPRIFKPPSLISVRGTLAIRGDRDNFSLSSLLSVSAR